MYLHYTHINHLNTSNSKIWFIVNFNLKTKSILFTITIYFKNYCDWTEVYILWWVESDVKIRRSFCRRITHLSFIFPTIKCMFPFHKQKVKFLQLECTTFSFIAQETTYIYTSKGNDCKRKRKDTSISIQIQKQFSFRPRQRKYKNVIYTTNDHRN